MASERMPPTKDMLPAFCVKQARLPSGDAVIRMKKEEYDALLLREPKAALRYVDESDGEIILVGSSLELSQRLAEPIERAPRTIAGVPLDLYAQGQAPMHSFDTTQEDRVLANWRDLDHRTTKEGEMAKQVFFGRQESSKQKVTIERPTMPVRKSDVEHSKTRATETTKTLHPAPLTLRTGGWETAGSYHQREQEARDDAKSLQQVEATAQMLASRLERASAPVTQSDAERSSKKEVRFGQPSPPRNSLTSTQPQQASPAHQRWASYSNLPAAFDKASTDAALPQVVKPRQYAAPKAPKSPFDVLLDPAAGQEVRSSTLQIPSTRKQTKEYQPLLETFWTQDPKIKPHPSKTEDNKDFHPLLDIFKEQLHQLGSTTAPPKVAAGPATSKDADSPPPALASNFNVAMKAQTPGELLTLSIQSLLNGVGQLTSAFKLTNSELQQQLAVAQRDFPMNIEKALKGSLTAIESLKIAIPSARSSISHSQSDQGTQASKPATSEAATNTPSQYELGVKQRFEEQTDPVLNPRADPKQATEETRTETSPKRTATAPIDKEAIIARSAEIPELRDPEQEEILRQSNRVEKAVEEMRLALLGMGWKKAATFADRVYTRADILEEFLACFNNMQAKALPVPKVAAADGRHETISPLSFTIDRQSAPAAPVFDGKVKDDNVVPLWSERPYSWDIDTRQWEAKPTTSGNSHRSTVEPFTAWVGDEPCKPYVYPIPSSPYEAPLWETSAPTPEPTSEQPLTCRCGMSFANDEHLKHYRQSECPFNVHPAPHQGWATGPEQVIRASDGSARRQSFDWQPLLPQKTHGSSNELSHLSGPAVNPPVSLHEDPRSSAAEKQPPTSRPKYSVSELADDQILERYPTITQFERRQPVDISSPRMARQRVGPALTRDAGPRGNRRDPTPERLGAHAARDSYYDAQPTQLATRMSIDGMRDRLDKRYPRGLGPRGLAAQHSMPTFQSWKGKQREDHTLYEGFTKQREPEWVRSHSGNMSNLSRAASARHGPAPVQSEANTVQRSKTVASSSAQNVKSQHRSPTYKPYEPAKYRPADHDTAHNVATSAPAPASGIASTISANSNITECKAKLLEMGFEPLAADMTSQLVEGDLESAIDMLEEEDSVRRTWHGQQHGELRAARQGQRQRQRHVPGSFDDELYG